MRTAHPLVNIWRERVEEWRSYEDWHIHNFIYGGSGRVWRPHKYTYSLIYTWRDRMED